MFHVHFSRHHHGHFAFRGKAKFFFPVNLPEHVQFLFEMEMIKEYQQADSFRRCNECAFIRLTDRWLNQRIELTSLKVFDGVRLAKCQRLYKVKEESFLRGCSGVSLKFNKLLLAIKLNILNIEYLFTSANVS